MNGRLDTIVKDKKMSKETEEILAEIAQVMLLLESHTEQKES